MVPDPEQVMAPVEKGKPVEKRKGTSVCSTCVPEENTAYDDASSVMLSVPDGITDPSAVLSVPDGAPRGVRSGP